MANKRTGTIDELFELQRLTGEEIRRLYSNFKKDSSERKNLQYVQKRLQTLNQYWSEFEHVDNEIRINFSGQDHEYFEKNYYDEVQNICHHFNAKLQELLAQHNQSLKASSNELLATKTVVERKSPPPIQVISSEPINDENMTITNRESHKSTPQSNFRQSNTSTSINQQQAILMNKLEQIFTTLGNDHRVHSSEYYKLKIGASTQHWNEILNMQGKLFDLLGNDTTALPNIQQYFDLEEQYHETLLHLQNRLTSIENSQNTTQGTNSVSTMKLPKIEISKFGGDYLKWHQFRDLFTELVHSQRIGNCQKMWYLKNSLTGEAEKLIQHLTSSDYNYDTAWNIICSRYENKRLLVSSWLNKLLSQPVILSENASALKVMHDTTQECLFALENIEINTANWDPILMHILLKKLDKSTYTLWEQSLDQPRAIPTIKNFLNFLETRFQSLEVVGKTENKHTNSLKVLSATIKNTCPVCKGNHQLFSCTKFLNLPISERISLVKRSNYCINCLKNNHKVSACPSRGCTKCEKRHNTLLHIPRDSTQKDSNNKKQATSSADEKPQSNQVASTSCDKKSVSLTSNSKNINHGYVLLSTAILKVLDTSNTAINCRAILDSGSQLNFITQRLVNKLRIKPTNRDMNIEGIGLAKRQSQKRVNITIESRINGFKTNIEAFILPRIVSPQPTQHFDISQWNIPSNIVLADPHFNQPNTIDLLIGAEIYHQILSVGQIKLGESLPTLQNTVFGWSAAGKISDSQVKQTFCGICTEDEEFEQMLEKSWLLDDNDLPKNTWTLAEKRCELHFTQNVSRNENGRFIVRLPFTGNPTELGESKDIAYQRFLSIERKLLKNEELKIQYHNFMKEYIELGHMKEINFNEVQKPYYFLPHHCVIKADSSTTKLRVVFDGSAKTTTNLSLNDVLAAGPTIQDNIFSILVRFRMHKYVFTADIEKMYRQVQVDERDRKYQLIWWRTNPTERIRCYELATVTYGTKSAPYLATRCLQLLAEQNIQKNPLGAKILKRDFYVDDVLSGADDISTAIDIQTQLLKILSSAGFKLRKWCGNHPLLLKHIPEQDQEIELDFQNKTEDSVKTVGLIWRPKEDEFSIKAVWKDSNKVTKRSAYSDISRLFDPLGIMAPVTITARIFLQKLWALKCDWDAALPQEMYTFWINFRNELKELTQFRFPRYVYGHKYSSKRTQIHIFADASEKAYGAAAYVRSEDSSKIITTRLLCAKVRVAPLKKTTLPRLELCAAKLAAELSHRLKEHLKLNDTPIYLWSDSKIVLAWINSPSSAYQTFVANRISVIQQLTIRDQWRHVPSEENPADIVSRGIMPRKLSTTYMWFYGPRFLHGAESLWPSQQVTYDNIEDIEKRRKLNTCLVTTEESNSIFNVIDIKGSFRKTQRVVAYVLRFIQRTRKINSTTQDGAILSTIELNEAYKHLIRAMQQEHFKDDILNLSRSGEVAKNSPLASLAPFLDSNCIIRVGGRLESSSLSYDAKHPMFLPYSHPLTKYLLKDIHNENMHVGPQTLLAIARQSVWPIKGKTLARSVVQQCVICARFKPKLAAQLMGNLPSQRVQPSRPFVNTGVDFCGPIEIHFKIRGKRPLKAYIAVFCCFSTKATHMEIVSDLTTQGFLGALRRFMARRGYCQTIYCDNATNFVGARNALNDLQKILQSEQAKGEIKTVCSLKNIEFRFIPPRAPHFGGLWESAVKSAKHLLQRTLMSASLTYEELETVVIEAEAILNSRPLTPMSDNPNDLSALTPGHFLIGEPLTTKIDPSAAPLKGNLLSRWKLVTHLKNEFWRRWTTEYLNQLQYRYKWKHKCQNIRPGDMVLVKEDNTPSLRWPLGRVVEAIKGRDELVRVADVRTANGIIRRPIHKLAPLPIETEKEDINLPSCHNETKGKDITIPSSNNEASGKSSHPATDSFQNSNSQPKKRQRISMGSALVTLLVTCMIFPIHGSPIEITYFKHQPGIYFESMGSANIISNEWNLIVYFDMAPYWKEYHFLQNCTQTLQEVCQRLVERNLCNGIIGHLQHLQAHLQDNHPLLSANNITRQRRGAINFIGKIANSLFGVLDSDYAEQMSQTIDKIHAEEGHLQDLLRNQTSIVDATLNIMKKQEESVHKQFQQLETHMKQINERISTVTTEFQQERIAQVFNSISLLASFSTSTLLQVQSALLEVLADTHYGRISPMLITPVQFENELMKIKATLPHALHLVIAQEDILSYFKIMKIHGRITSRHIIFKLSIPLSSLEDFELFKIVPIPVFINNAFVLIKPSSSFLVINLYRDQYYPLNENELNSCTLVSKGRYLCKQRHPIHRRGSSISACEVDFINHVQHPLECQIIKIGNGPHWIQLNSPNQWVFAFKNKMNINVVCGQNITQYTLEGTGILQIREQCIIKQPFITIQGHSIYPSSTRLSFTPTSNLSDWVISNHISKIPNFNVTSHHSYLNEINKLKEELQNFKNNIPVTYTIHDAHQTAVGYGCLLLIIALISFLIWRFRSLLFRKSLKTRSAPPIPPRRSLSRETNSRITEQPFRVAEDV